MNGESGQLDETIEVKLILLVGMPDLECGWGEQTCKERDRRGAVEDEAQHHLVMLAADALCLAKELNEARAKHIDGVDKRIVLDQLDVRAAGEDPEVEIRPESLQVAENRRRNDHIADAIVAEDQQFLNFAQVDRRVEDAIVQDYPEKGINQGLAESTFEEFEKSLHDTLALIVRA
jgi:hypothetical protein